MSKKFIDLLKILRLYELAKIINSQLIKLNPSFRSHQHEMLKFYSQFISKGDKCFDVGANMGNRTDIFLELGASVMVVEPQQACYSFLEKKYKKNPKVKIIKEALGAKKGKAKMMISNASTLSSLSKEWVNKVKNSGRFVDNTWDKTTTVKLTTLDDLITKYGKPVFCKIDVEGFELQVLKGLSKSIKFLSFEFTPEYINSTVSCINHLSAIGDYKYNYSLGESMNLVSLEWMDNKEIREKLVPLSDDVAIFGDVYAKRV